MLSILTVIIVFCLYMGLMFWIARKTEKGSPLFQKWSAHPFVCATAMGIFCTTWTYYGGVGKAATSGLIYLTIYLGPTLSIFLWPLILRKMVRIKHSCRITSIADFISARYNKSQILAALVTLIALVGVIPYVALQLRATFSTFRILVVHAYHGGSISPLDQYMAWLIIILMIIFTIIFGARRLDPTETHKGMLLSVAIQSIVQLVALLCVGVFVTFFVFHGFDDMFVRLAQSPFSEMIYVGKEEDGSYMVWFTYLILSMSAILFLPRQFHVAVVENEKEEDIAMVLWVFPLYMFLMNLFVIPIAIGGLLSGFPVEQADSFVLRLPLYYGKFWLAVVVFLGGISAAVSMIMISSMTIATMVTNHVFLPLINKSSKLDFLKKHLLRFRWLFIAMFILASYRFESSFQRSYMLANLGLISFAAVLQFAPIIIGALYWRKANRRGALWGLTGGFVIWFYTLLFPALIKSGWGFEDVLSFGPWGIDFLRPENLLGMRLKNHIVHAVFWSMFVNISMFILGSLSRENTEMEKRAADIFINAFSSRSKYLFSESSRLDRSIHLSKKIPLIEKGLEKYFPEAVIAEMIKGCLVNVGITQEDISVLQLAELQGEVEKMLTGSLGSGVAHDVIGGVNLFSEGESHELSHAYAEILSNFKLTPEELINKIDYHKERELLLARHAAELEEKIIELDKQVLVRKAAEKAVIESEFKYRSLVENLPQRIFRKDKDSFFTYCNDIFAKDLGLAREEIPGKTDFDFFDRETSERYRRDDVEVVEKGKTVDSEEKYAVGGKEIWVHTVKAPIRDDKNNVVGILGIFWDISERKKVLELLHESKNALESRVKERTSELIQANKELHSKITELERTKSELEEAYLNLKETKNQLFQVEKLASIGQLAAGVAHEINNPIGFIKNNITILEDYWKNLSVYIKRLKRMTKKGTVCKEEDLAMIRELEKDLKIDFISKDLPSLIKESQEGTERIRKIVMDLKSFARKSSDDEIKMENINKIVDTAINIVWNEIKHKAEITTDKRDLPEIKCNGQQICQVVVNLLMNASQAVEGMGKIFVNTYEESEFVCISIKDNGVGMSQQVMNRIFDPFFTTKEVGQGTGLGLSISFDVVKKHKGLIDVESKVGEGTTFIIKLPLIS